MGPWKHDPRSFLKARLTVVPSCSNSKPETQFEVAAFDHKVGDISKQFLETFATTTGMPLVLRNEAENTESTTPSAWWWGDQGRGSGRTLPRATEGSPGPCREAGWPGRGTALAATAETRFLCRNLTSEQVSAKVEHPFSLQRPFEMNLPSLGAGVCPRGFALTIDDVCSGFPGTKQKT